MIAAAFAVQPLAAAAPPPRLAIATPRLAHQDVAAMVEEAARRFSIPVPWIYAVMRRESAGDAHAVSPKGASGLMQLMPATWAGLRVRYGLGDDIFDPHDNILAGAAYLRELYDRYGSPGFIAAYNAGPGRYDAWLAARKPLPAETLVYVSAVSSALEQGRATPRAAMSIARPDWSRSSLFAGAERPADGRPLVADDASPDHGRASGSHLAASLSLFAPIGRPASSH